MIFSIGPPGATPRAAAVKIDGEVGTAIWLAKVALYLGLFLGIGGSFARHGLERSSAPEP